MATTEQSTPSESGNAGSFQATALSLSMTVKDLQKSVSWYTDVLGMSVDRRIERDGQLRAVAVRAGDARILLNQDDGAKGWDRSKGEGISMMFSTKQDIDEIAAWIKAAGGTLETEPDNMPWGVRAFRVRDPDGFRWSISGDPK